MPGTFGRGIGVCFAVMGVMAADFGVFSCFTFSFFSLLLPEDFLDGVADRLGGWTTACFFVFGLSAVCSALTRLADWSPLPECLRFRSPFVKDGFVVCIWLAGVIDAVGVTISTSDPLFDSLSELEESATGFCLA